MVSFQNSGLFERVSEQLRPYMGSESRMEALNLLMSAQLCDVVASEGKKGTLIILFRPKKVTLFAYCRMEVNKRGLVFCLIGHANE